MTAALIVFGGTAGATIMAHRQEDLSLGYQLFLDSFRSPTSISADEILQETIACAQLARTESLLALEKRLKGFKSPYMKSVYRFVIDGVDEVTLREIFDKERETTEEKMLAGAKVWVDAGGYAPTIGILGAVLGLIHVMGQLTDTSALGKGIAVAFVATIYGVGSANLIFLPIAGKIRSVVFRESDLKKMILEGAIAIQKNQHPQVIQEKLQAYRELPAGRIS
jgi:chemotaxis protein MotA